MAKQRQNHSVVSAIKSVTAALRLEAIADPTPEQKQQIQQAKINAADVIDNSNFVTMGENADDAIELQHQIAEAEAAEAEAAEAEAEVEADADAEAAKTADTEVAEINPPEIPIDN